MTKHKLFKLGAAAALTVTGVSAITSLKTAHAANFTAIKRVKINYLPGKGLNIWTNYNKGKFMGYRAKDGTIWNVAETAVDKKGNLWYKVGTREWIEARYTVDVGMDTPASTNAKTKKSTAKNVVNNVISLGTVTKKSTKKSKVTKAKAAKVKKAKQIVDAAVKKTSKKSTTKKVASTQAPSNAGAIVALAKQQVGKPYAWGANGPDSFDCSSLVQYIFKNAAGMNLPRTTYDQVKIGQTVYQKSQANGQPVSANNLQVGDLLFWGSESSPYHVAIYIGNNQYVNAATPEQGTILQTMTSYFAPTIVKRVL
ncbi:C40 family peptidase [Lactobacillus helveticus]|uniref:C40 family peptidase n=2 Tax=Lactobacillus helveticus TaxID=1587 RepID=UPI001562DA9F|nr:C40 family peptidase [Lactobacillus helveticus]NRN93946.1 Murein DD-endopeptidase MepS/Murein LD-carboxypeptidase [Lactobacillus helveticus]NRO37843.1 Murein DD-endopeptidase MepS/Murein LD-carboxypeptidase [Lactobacillus helveticus]NRO49579.1 Murein DD-endopeptidase MepS/Murein LD-carboxypeptidase [Lactobacillus helveticus]